jgi:hypothetical protein
MSFEGIACPFASDFRVGRKNTFRLDLANTKYASYFDLRPKNPHPAAGLGLLQMPACQPKKAFRAESETGCLHEWAFCRLSKPVRPTFLRVV